MNWRTPRVRLLLVAAFVMLWMGAAFARLAYLQLFCYSDYLNRAEHQQQRIVEVSPRRGILYDRNFHELAMSLTMESCYAMPAEITDQDMVARLLSGVLETSPEDISAKLAASSSFVWIARKLPPEKAARIKEMNLRGVYFVPERQRFYPKMQLASHVLGYVDIDEKGLGGIEYALDSEIRGRPGRMMVLADARQRWFDSAEKGTEAGTNIVLTLDQNIQYIAEKELAQAIHDTHAISGTVLVEETSTGRMLAAANWPTFDPNSRGEASAEARMNRAITAMYEPGSVFKIVTVAGALEEGLTNPDEVIDCQMGAIYVAGHRIRDHKPFGMLTVAQILAKSSDVGAIKLGLRLGPPKLYDYIRAFGFGSPTGIDLPGEGHGKLRRLENWTPISVGSISMGQEVGVTAIQLISAMNAIGNGGIWVKPHVVLGTRYDTKFISTEQIETRRAISPQTAATMRALLQGVVLEGGTGPNARLDGYTAAGKTGTAQKIDTATGRYSQSQTYASFVGFAPINNPAITILVTLDSPVGLHEGGEVSAPVFKRIAEQVLSYLNVPQDVPVNAHLQRASYQNSGAGSNADMSDFDPAQMESATAPADIVAPPPQRPSADTPAQTIALVDGEAVSLPSLAGKTVREVSEQCAKLGIAPVLVGTGLALDQDPKAGTTVRRGSRVTVQFGRPAPPAAPPAHPADKRN
ncbi:MAG TPA: penicillin-binding protein [Candidatus Acidoferrum sp.]|nr:penicillin-binding protein [Candidatus Acidoferrum sp.]